VLFTSKWVAEEFENNIEPLISRKNLTKKRIPSPSPIFRRMSLKDKIEIYQKELPEFSTGFIERITEPIIPRIIE
jgi:hypothetical protein